MNKKTFVVDLILNPSPQEKEVNGIFSNSNLPIRLKLSVLTILLFCTGSFLFGQNTNTPADTSKKPLGEIIRRDTVYENGQMIIYVTREAEKPVKQKKEERVEEPKEIEYKGNIYRTKSGWVNIGYGISSYLRPVDYPFPNFHVAFHIPMAGTFLKLGVNSSRIDNRSRYRNTYGLVGLGNRTQGLKHQYSYFVGLTYLAGHVMVFDSLNNKQYARMGGPGAFAEVSAYYKFFYDMGLGATAFANLDFKAPLIGIRLELYFSNAFKKKKPEY